MKEMINKLRVPVLDSVVTSWKYAEMMADMYRKVGLVHSKLYRYEPPPDVQFGVSPIKHPLGLL
jgi:hypothetical protein